MAPKLGRGKRKEGRGPSKGKVLPSEPLMAIAPAYQGHNLRGAGVAMGPGGSGLQAAQEDGAGFRIHKAALGKNTNLGSVNHSY